MKFKVGDKVRTIKERPIVRTIKERPIESKFKEVGFVDPMENFLDQEATIEKVKKTTLGNDMYTISTNDWNWTSDWLKPGIVDNKLNRKLYPNYIPIDGYLVREE